MSVAATKPCSPMRHAADPLSRIPHWTSSWAAFRTCRTGNVGGGGGLSIPGPDLMTSSPTLAVVPRLICSAQSCARPGMGPLHSIRAGSELVSAYKKQRWPLGVLNPRPGSSLVPGEYMAGPAGAKLLRSGNATSRGTAGVCGLSLNDEHPISGTDSATSTVAAGLTRMFSTPPNSWCPSSRFGRAPSRIDSTVTEWNRSSRRLRKAIGMPRRPRLGQPPSS